MGTNVDSVMKRFIRCVKDGEDARKLHSIVSLILKQDFVKWTDESRLDALHYAVLAGNSVAVDFLLKIGYFVIPHEPLVSTYAHLAAYMGYQNVLVTILQYRPEDFKVSELPLVVPAAYKHRSRTHSRPHTAKETEGHLPAVLGNQVGKDSSGSHSFMSKKSLSSNVSAFFFSASRSSSRDTTAGRPSSYQVLDAVDSYSRPSSPHVEHGEDIDRLQRIFDRAEGAENVQRQDSGCFPRHRVSRHQEHSSGGSILTNRLHARGFSCTPAIDATQKRRDSMPKEKPKTERNVPTKRRNSSPIDSSRVSSSISSPEKCMSLRCTPLEVAARWGHLDCVKALLDMYVLRVYPELGVKGYITLATLANDVPSLNLLLSQAGSRSLGTSRELQAARREDYRTAVEVCLRNVFPSCLELLLKEALVDPKSVFKQVNFYHVLYISPTTTYKRLVSVARLPAVTRLLIKRMHDVEAKVPSRTYPLYTLIHGAFSILSRGDFSYSEYFITCMQMLLKNGAKPNFDEMQYERTHPATAIQSGHQHGRPAFTSALHCVLHSLEWYCHSKQKTSQVIHLVEECLDVLLVHGAHIEKVGSLQGDGESAEDEVGDVLFQFAKSSVTIGLDRGLLRYLVRYGAQPQRKINGQYALNVYFNQVCAVLRSAAGRNEKSGRPSPLKDVSALIKLMCSYMAPWHTKDALDIFNLRHDSCTHNKQHREFVQLVNEEMDIQRKTVHTLRNVSAWRVWKLCGRTAHNIQALPVSKEIRMTVLPLLLFQAMW